MNGLGIYLRKKQKIKFTKKVKNTIDKENSECYLMYMDVSTRLERVLIKGGRI